MDEATADPSGEHNRRRGGAWGTTVEPGALGAYTRTSLLGEKAPEREALVHPLRRRARKFWPALSPLVFAALLSIAGCGGGEGQTQQASPADAASSGAAAGGNTGGGPRVGDGVRAETLQDSPFTLNTDRPVPPDFRAAYQREAPIVVEFFEKGKDPYYPKGDDVDAIVHDYLLSLRDEYPQVEFFSYDINTPGEAGTSEGLNRGEYGTLAAQLGVGYTPFIAMLSPGGEGYVIENLFQGYVDEGVLDQALYELARSTAG